MTSRNVLFPFGILILAILACNFPIAKPQVDNAYLARDFEGKQPTRTFEQDEGIFGIVELNDSPLESNIRAVWIASDVDETATNFQINETEITTSSGIIHFELFNERLWPKGKYQLNIYLDGELERILEFDVQ